MDLRNRLGLYGAYFLAMAGIGFTLPYLPLYLRERGMSDRAIGLVSTLAALAGLVQFPVGLWSDRLGRRKPFLVAALVLLAAATFLLRSAHDLVWLAFLVVLFAENGACRATLESLAGAEATHLAPPGQVGAALGVLRLWRPVAMVLAALLGSLVAGRYSPDALLLPLAVGQAAAVALALLLHEDGARKQAGVKQRAPDGVGGRRDGVLWLFVTAMILFHIANAPGGVYLGLFLKTDLGASDGFLPYAFVVSMPVWVLTVWPAGRLSDRIGRKPLLVLGWTACGVRLALIALAGEAWQVLAVQVLDGFAQGLFAVATAAWVTDRLADPRRAGEAQVLVGSALVFGSAVGPLLAGLIVGPLGYRGMFGLLAGVAAVATLLVVALVPEIVAVRAAAAAVPEAAPVS
jgi:MFS family permease